MAITPEHPKKQLLFCIDSDQEEHHTAEMEDAVRQLASARAWTISPPEFVDVTEEPDDPDSDDLPIRTVGGLVELYRIDGEWFERTPVDVVRSQLHDVKAIVEAMSAFSARTGLDIAFELNDDSVGWIKRGSPNRLLREGMLDEWERALAARNA